MHLNELCCRNQPSDVEFCTWQPISDNDKALETFCAKTIPFFSDTAYFVLFP